MTGRPGEIRIRIDEARMRAEVGQLTQAAVQRGADRLEDRYRSNIQADGLVNTGDLLGSVTQAPVPGRDILAPAIAVGSPLSYAKYPEYGTRAHGPVKASRLRFVPKGGAGFVYAKWVRGVKPYRFAARALDAMRPVDFEL